MIATQISRHSVQRVLRTAGHIVRQQPSPQLRSHNLGRRCLSMIDLSPMQQLATPIHRQPASNFRAYTSFPLGNPSYVTQDGDVAQDNGSNGSSTGLVMTFDCCPSCVDDDDDGG